MNAHATKHRESGGNGRGAFTLIEMLTVMAIMMIMMTIAMISFVSWGKGAAARSATLEVKSHLVSARQWAITHRVRTSFTYGNCTDFGPTRGYLLLSNAVDQVIGNTNYLPAGVVLTDSAGVPLVVTNIIFKLDGSCAGDATPTTIVIVSKNITNKITVYPLTGRATLKTQ